MLGIDMNACSKTCASLYIYRMWMLSSKIGDETDSLELGYYGHLHAN